MAEGEPPDEPHDTPAALPHRRRITDQQNKPFTWDCEDEDVREFFFRADFSVTSDTDRRRFRKIMDYVVERMEARERMRVRRTRFFIWLFGTVGVAGVGTAAGLVTEWLKLNH